jgi:hypothetical protein
VPKPDKRGYLLVTLLSYTSITIYYIDHI